MKKLSEIKTGEKFAFEGRFFMGVETAADDSVDMKRVIPISLETAKYGLNEDERWNDPDTLVTPCSWEEFKMTVKSDEVDEHPIQGMMLTAPSDGQLHGIDAKCVIIDEFADSRFTEKDMATLRRLFIERYPPEPKPPEGLIEKADISFTPTFDPSRTIGKMINIRADEIPDLMAAHMKVNSGPFAGEYKARKRTWMMLVSMVHDGEALIEFRYKQDGWDSTGIFESEKRWRRWLGKLFPRLKYEKQVFEMYEETDFNKWF